MTNRFSTKVSRINNEEKDDLLNKWRWGELDIHMQKNEIPYLTPYSKINSKLSKLIKDLMQDLKLLNSRRKHRETCIYLDIGP